MKKISEAHIKKISTVLSQWFTPDNSNLKTAIERTVSEGFFSFEDVKHQVLALKHTTEFKHLIKWVNQSAADKELLAQKNILCLHAGNLPLVGFHDALAVIITGGNYVGKISRKDPYLLPALLQRFSESMPELNLQWNSQIEQLPVKEADALLFAGSEQSSRDVLALLKKKNIISESTPKLIRTAHYSVALITENSADTMRDLTEAVFRYGGAGCRSVAVVVAPFSLNAEKCTFTDYIEEFWLNNPQLKKPDRSLFHRYAFNKALNIEQAWLDNFLIEEHLSKPGEKFVLKWIKGGKSTLDEILQTYSKGIQSVYSTQEFIGKKAETHRIEPLSSAQKPPIWWKPDQIDTISWLLENAGNKLQQS